MDKKYITIALAASLLSCVMTGCDKQTPVEKANELVEKSGLKLPHFNQLDSIIGYQQAYSCRMAANNLHNNIETALWKSRTGKQALGETGRKECLEMADEAAKLERQAAEIELGEGLRQTPKEFIGFASPMIADSVSNDTIYTIYFDKDVTKILSIKKKVLGL